MDEPRTVRTEYEHEYSSTLVTIVRPHRKDRGFGTYFVWPCIDILGCGFHSLVVLFRGLFTHSVMSTHLDICLGEIFDDTVANTYKLERTCVNRVVGQVDTKGRKGRRGKGRISQTYESITSPRI